jgi:hypothetical protein
MGKLALSDFYGQYPYVSSYHRSVKVLLSATQFSASGVYHVIVFLTVSSTNS